MSPFRVVAAAGLMMGAIPAAPAAAAEIPAPIVAYDFDAIDPAAGVVPDTSGHGLDGALVNGATATVVDGASGGHAVQLPGGAPTATGAYVTLPLGVLTGRSDLTVSVRVRWDGGQQP